MQSTSQYPTRLDYLRLFCFSFNVVPRLSKKLQPPSLHNALSVRWVMTLKSIVIILLADFSSGSAQIRKYPLCIAWSAKMTSWSSVSESCRRKVWEGFWWFGMRNGGLGWGMVWDKGWFGMRDGLGWGMVIWLDVFVVQEGLWFLQFTPFAGWYATVCMRSSALSTYVSWIGWRANKSSARQNAWRGRYEEDRPVLAYSILFHGRLQYLRPNSSRYGLSKI